MSNKKQFSNEEWDALLDEALGREPMRPVPLGLYRDIRVKLQIAAMLDKERRRFRRTLMMGFAGICSIAGLSFLVAQLTEASGIASGVMFGGMGMYDSMAATMGVEWSAFTLLLFVVAAGLAVLSALSMAPEGKESVVRSQ
jgi:hypothetical protein